jgi:hypothetical protein
LNLYGETAAGTPKEDSTMIFSKHLFRIALVVLGAAMTLYPSFIGAEHDGT